MPQSAGQDTAGQMPPSRFADGKAAGAFRSIGEVAMALAIRPHVLRYWEEQFPMLRPVKRGGGRRHYRPEDVALLETIDRLVHREGYTLRGARQWLEVQETPGKSTAKPVAPAAKPPAVAAEHVPKDLIARLAAIRTDLAKALSD